MRMRVCVGLLVSAVTTGRARADFEAVIAVDVTDDAAQERGLIVTDLYATGATDAERLLSVGHTDIVATCDWFQDPGGNHKAPNHALAALAGFELAPYDSFVSFSLHSSEHGDSTTLDPSFLFSPKRLEGGWFNIAGVQGEQSDIGALTGNARDRGVFIARLTMIVGEGASVSDCGYSGSMTLFTARDPAPGHLVHVGFQAAGAPGVAAPRVDVVSEAEAHATHFETLPTTSDDRAPSHLSGSCAVSRLYARGSSHTLFLIGALSLGWLRLRRRARRKGANRV